MHKNIVLRCVYMSEVALMKMHAAMTVIVLDLATWHRGSMIVLYCQLAEVTRHCPGHHIEVIKCIMRGKVAR